MTYLRVIASLLLLVGILAVQPTPNCSQGFFYQTLPITPNQLVRYDLDDLFTGFNIDFTLTDASEYDFINVTKKLTVNAQQTLVDELVGLKSVHVEEAGNEWGQGFIALTEKGNDTTIQYGILTNNKSAPVINYRVIVERQADTKCFDAILFAAKDLILIDCMIIRSKPGDDGKLFQNRFIYVKLSEGKVMPHHVDNQLYVNYTSITRRKLQLYTDHETGHHFMLRAYFADGVDRDNRHNTYIDVFSITDPMLPWSLRVIDRSIIHKTEFAITDFKMYLGDIYVLDYWQGLFRVDITNHMQIILLGHYAAEGYTKFSVFSEDMDDTFIIALANTHYIIEVDWSDRLKPLLLSKYTILPNSTIEQIALNLDYLVLQSFTPVTKADGTHVIYNYTWIFNRADRTFNKAFKVINHNTYRSAIFLNKAKSYLLVVDDDAITNYAIERPILSIKANNNEQIQNQMLNFTVVAQSTDPLSTTRATCRLTVNFTIVSENNKTIWPTGRVPPSFFSVNAPGDLYIPIHDYVLGPNVTYHFQAFGQNPPKSHVFQQDQMDVHWTNSPGLISSRFLYADLWKQNNGNDTIVLYIQDYSNKFYVSFCETRPLDLEVFCNNSIVNQAPAAIKHWGSGTYMNIHSQQEHHVIAFTLQSENNTVFVNDLTQGNNQVRIQYPSGYAGFISAMEITNNYLVVCQQYIKTITIYNLEHCTTHSCRPLYEINSTTMKKLGINYFSPINVETSIFHDEVIFIQTEHSVIVLDVDRDHHPILLGVIESDTTRDTESQFRMEINNDYLFITNYPRTIQEYDISDLYKFRITKIKNYPLYGYTLPQDYDFDVSDQGDTVFVTVLAPDGVTRQIFVYRGGFPTVASLYDTIQIDAQKQVLLDVTGFQVDYAIAIVGSVIKIFKQLQSPLAVATGVQKDSEFVLQFYNDQSEDTNLSIIIVKVQNWPTKIIIDDYYKDIMNTKDLLTSGENVTCEFDDEQWHTGHVVNVTAVCPDCGDKVIVKGHVHEEREVLGIPGMHDYQWGYDGGSVQQESHIIHMLHNGSIDEIVNLPQAEFGEKCLRIGVPVIGSYQVSACQSNKGVQVYITSFISNKGFAWGPWSTSATKVNRIEVIRQLVMLVDTDRERSMTRREGGIYLFAINMRPDSSELLEEVDIINSDDFGGVAGWDSSQKAYLSNAELTWTYEIDTYRLLITEETKGMFVVDFKWQVGSPELTIKNIDFIDLPKLLETNGYHMPYDARFEAITVLHSQYDHQHKYENQSILVTTGRFHTFQIGLSTDDSGIVINLVLERVYLRYAGFHVQNYIRHHNNYFLISQTAPQSEIDKKPDISKQIISVYHTEGLFNGTVENRSMRSAYVMKDRELHLFDFNWTFMGEGERVGLALVDRQSKTIKELSVYKNITVTTKEQLPAQIIRLNFSNDYSYDQVRIYLKGTTAYPKWKFVLIIVSGVTGVFLLAAVGFVIFMKIKGRSGEYSEDRQSLMTDTN